MVAYSHLLVVVQTRSLLQSCCLLTFFCIVEFKGCSGKYSAEFQMAGIAISDWAVDACTA